MIQEQLNFSGDQLRDQGMERTLTRQGDEWKERVLEEIVYISHRQETFTSDDIRQHCKDLAPKSGKSWGAVISAACKLGLIEKTGRYLKSSIPTNHSRVNPEWRRA